MTAKATTIGHRLQAHQLPGTQPATVVGDVTDPTCRLVATSSSCTSASSNTPSSLQLLCNFHADVSSRFKPSHCNCVVDRTLSKTNCHATIMQLSRSRLLSLQAFKPHAVNCYFNVTSCKQLPCKPRSTVHHCNPSSIVLPHCNFHYAALQI